MTDKAITEREFANEQLARAHDAEKALKTVHELLKEAISSHDGAQDPREAWAWNRVHTARALLDKTRAAGDPRIWALADELHRELQHVAPEDMGVCKAKIYDTLIRARSMP